MIDILPLAFLWALARKSFTPFSSAPTASAPAPTTPAPLPSSPTAAATAAQQAAQHAAANPTPQNLQAAAAASQHAATVTHSAAKKAQQAEAAPKPWPQAKPTGLPPFPSGWELDTPPPQEVITRAWQLLPTLWKRGKGATTVETTGGRWITYQAQDHSGGKKGVTAYRVKGTGKAVSTKSGKLKPHGASASY